MNPDALKIFGISALLFAATAGSAVYMWQMEEGRGNEIRQAMVVTASANNGPAESADLTALDELDSLVLPGAGETVDFLAFVEDVALRTGVTIDVANLDVVKTKAKGFDDLSASFVVTGPKIAVEQVLAVFENLPYHSRVTSMNLERRGTEARADLSVVLTVRE